MSGIQARRVLAAACVAVSAACLLCGYELIRSVSQSLYIGAYGAVNLPWVMAGAPLGTLALIWAYGHVLSMWGARRAMVLTCAGATGAMLLCWWVIGHGSKFATAVLYILREGYIVLLVEQIWAFIDSTFTTEEGRRLNGPICGVASLGAIAGGLLVRTLAQSFGSVNLLGLAAASLIPTAVAALAAYQLGGEPQPMLDELHGKKGHLGARTLWRDPVLRRLALLIIATQVVSTVLDLQLSRYVEAAFPEQDARTRWFGGFYAVLNIGSAVGQFVAAPLLLQWLCLRAVHVGIPLVHLILVGISIGKRSLTTAAAALMAFKIMDYSVFRAAKELLYVPMPYDARYRSKELIDAFGYRLGKGSTSALLAVIGRFVVVPTVSLPIIALAALAAWLRLAAAVTRPCQASRVDER